MREKEICPDNRTKCINFYNDELYNKNGAKMYRVTNIQIMIGFDIKTVRFYIKSFYHVNLVCKMCLQSRSYFWSIFFFFKFKCVLKLTLNIDYFLTLPP